MNKQILHWLGWLLMAAGTLCQHIPAAAPLADGLTAVGIGLAGGTSAATN